MNKFGAAVLASALAATSHATCPVDCNAIAGVLIPISVEDCERNPCLAILESLTGYNFTWTHYDAQTSTGYDVALVRFIGDD